VKPLKENSLFEHNLEVIKQCDKLLYDELIKYDLESYVIDNVAVEESLDHVKIVKTWVNQYEWYFNSKYAAKAAAKNWVDTLGKIESTAIITVFGFGNGLYLKEMMDRSYQSVIFIIYEPSIQIFLKVMKEIDLSFLDERIYISVEGLNDNYFDAYFQTFTTYGNLSVCKYLCHPNYFECFKESGKRYLQKVKKGIGVLEAYTNSDIRLSEAYFINSISNIKFLANASILEQMEKVVGKTIPKDFPVIVVSAGPSLKKNINELKKAKHRAFIIATDTALKALLAENIIPDVFVSVDSNKHPNKFEDVRIALIPMICFETSRHFLLARHRDKIIFMNDTYGFGDVLFRNMGIKYRYWSGGSSVATNAYTAAMAMGFKTIILVGQDLAYTNNERHYEKGLGDSRFENMDDKSMFLEVEDIHGGKITTSKDFKLYLDWFEVEISLHKEIDTIDATEGGAKIHGSRIMSLKEAIDEKCNIEFNMEEYMKKIPSLLDEKEKTKLTQLINKIPKQFEELLEDADEGVRLYTELICELEKMNPDSSKLLKLGKEIGMNTEKIEESKAYKIAQHKLKKIEYITLSNLGVSLDDATEDAMEVAKRGIIMMESLRLALDEVIQIVKKSVESIEINE
jgi:hypothetical protein